MFFCYLPRVKKINPKDRGFRICVVDMLWLIAETDGIEKIQYRLVPCTTSICIIPYRTATAEGSRSVAYAEIF